MLGCKACEAVQDTLGGVARKHMRKTRHTAGEKRQQSLTPTEQFDLVGSVITTLTGSITPLRKNCDKSLLVQNQGTLLAMVSPLFPPLIKGGQGGFTRCGG